MAFAAVLTALGYYIILRRFCQGLLKIFLQGAATGEEVFPLCRLPTPAFGVLPCPCPPRRGRLRQVEQARRGDSSPAGDSGGRASNAGASPPPARDTPLLRCRPTGRQGTAPRAAFVRPAPGGGPSQTPPSRATDSSISPGPPSPWLPAPLKVKKFCRSCGEPQVQPRGCKGRSPLHEITLVSPFPAGEGGRGDRGQENKLKAG